MMLDPALQANRWLPFPNAEVNVRRLGTGFYLYDHALHDFVKPSGLHARREPKLIGGVRCCTKHCDYVS
jgi:hypothetical protein